MLRVIQWATGSVGKHAVAAVHAHRDLELVGALVYSDAKAGRDVGDICGIGDIGVAATADRDEIVALDADCVLYMPQGEMNPMGAVDDICRLLASGKNVVSTAVTGLIYPLSMGSGWWTNWKRPARRAAPHSMPPESNQAGPQRFCR